LFNYRRYPAIAFAKKLSKKDVWDRYCHYRAVYLNSPEMIGENLGLAI